jgi:hypothetical protein
MRKRKRFIAVGIALGGIITATALATVVAALRVNTTAPEPVTELGGGGATPPLQALNDVWDYRLSAPPARCATTSERTRRTSSKPSGPSDRSSLNGFGAAYRDVLFQKVAPGYVSIFDVPLRQKKDAGHDGRHSSRATRMETATATRSS